MNPMIFRNLVVVGVCLVLSSCAGQKALQNSAEIDDTWAGIWKGQALIENTVSPPRTLEIEIVFTSTHVKAFFSDSHEEVSRQLVDRLALEGDTIRFRASYDTKRGLHAVVSFTGERNSRHLVLEFDGSEGGRSFHGKWQAEHTPPPSVQPTKEEGKKDEKVSASKSGAS